MKKILIGSPVHQKPLILKEFLNSLSQLESQNLEIHFLFIDDNEDLTSSTELATFKAHHPNVRVEKNVEEQIYNPDSHVWQDAVILKVGKNKDKILKFARENNFDFVFLVDSDLVLHPKTLTHLTSLEQDIVSEVFYTSWKEGTMEMPQVWLYDTYEFTADKTLSEQEKSETFFQFLNTIKAKGVYRVGGLGACTLISRAALNKGVSFERIYNLSFWGEDRHFCIRAAALGIDLLASTFYPPLHLYRESDLEKVPDFWQGI